MKLLSQNKIYCLFKTLTLAISLAILVFGNAAAQTFNPSCYSNADGWSVTKIEKTFDGTYVYLNYYSYKKNYEFWIDPGMYIENNNSSSSPKFLIKEFLHNKLNRRYILKPFTTYNFVLKFEKIPDIWTEINIIEPTQIGNVSWYWKCISLNQPEYLRLNLDNFILNSGIDFLKSVTHPTNIFKGFRYNVDYNMARVTLYYEDYYTDLKIKFNGKLVTDIIVVDDNDFIEPFASLQLIKDFIVKLNQKKAANDFEKYIGKVIKDMTAIELACLTLTILRN